MIAPDTSGASDPDGVDVMLDRCLAGLAAALAAATRPGAGLWDAVEGRPSAPDHYGQLGAALALLILRGAQDECWREPLDAWLGTPRSRRGHAPFNRFLLHLLEESLPDGADDLRRRLAGERRACELHSRYPSNNWTLLANVCRLLEADGAAPRRRALDRLLVDLERWTTAAGGFVDFPFHGNPIATPSAYHHKALFLVAVAARRTGDARLEAYLRRMLAWSAMFWDEGGHAGGLGRSSHALYGDSCLLAALTLLAGAREDRRDQPMALMMRSMLKRWMEGARSDGLLPLNPAAADDRRQGWDGYMRLSVYNAWAAAILAWAHGQEESAPVPASFDPVESDAEAGIHRLRGGDGLLVLVSTRGQPPQAFSSSEAELRYAGGVPFHAACGTTVLCPPAVRIDGEALRAEPAHAGWTPLFDCGGVLYALTDFERCDVREDETGTSITLEGRPLRLLRAESGSLCSRIRRGLDWRLLDGALGRREALHRPPLTGLRARLTLMVERERSVLRYRLLLRKEGNARIRYLNPGGHALVASRIPERALGLRRGAQGMTMCGADELREVALQASIRDAAGWCLSPTDLPEGEFEIELALSWIQDPRPSRSRSSSSR